MNIQLPGYVTAFENEVYLRDSEIITGYPAEFKDILLLRRYTHPSEEQVEKYLVNAINNLDAQKVRALRPSSVEIAIEESLLPETRRHLGLEKCRECLDMIKKQSPAIELEGGNRPPQYLEALYGIIPASILEQNIAAGYVTEGKWYEMILHFPTFTECNLGLKYSLSIELENGDFPHYYKKKTQSAGIVNLHALENLVEILKRNFDMAERVNALRDVSEQILETAVIMPLYNYSEQLNSLSAKHLAEAGKVVKRKPVKKYEMIKRETEERPKTVKSETTERTPPSIGKKAQPLFAVNLFKKNVKPEKPN